jgi:beta-galactosidase/beta-glucuronidase
LIDNDHRPLFDEYPRPHLKRDNWLNLNGRWAFRIASLNEPYPKRYDRFINVPFPVESNLSGIQKRIDSTMFLWYKREFRLQFSSKERVLLHFEKVDYETLVYLNDHFIGSKHLGGYDPFSYDITSYIKSNSNNRIVVRVWDPSDHWYQARGKQVLDVKDPRSIYYTPCSGIWGTVWIEKVPLVRIDRLKFQTTLSPAILQLTYRIDLYDPSIDQNAEERERLLDIPRDDIPIKPNQRFEKEGYYFQIKIFKPNDEIFINFTTHQTNQDSQITFPLSDIQLWSPENPYLYDIQIDLYHDHHFIERVMSYIGFRQISLCEQPKRICLNNQPYFMYGVLDQGYWPDGLYRAPDDDAYRYDIKQMKILGFNTLRKHMKIETSRWYYWCDRLGMLVWQDMPAGDSYYGYEVETEQDKQLRLHRDNRTTDLPEDSSISNEINRYRPEGTERQYQSKIQFEQELKSMIDFLSFHPSIIIWVLFNEEWGQYDTIRLAKWIEYYDPSRLVNAASGWQDRVGCGHMRDIHDYTKNIYLPQIDDQNRALVLGECGGFGLEESGWSYNSYPDRYFMTYAFEQLVLNLSPRLSAMIYTQLSDVETESNGIFTYNRENIKFLPDHLNRVLTKNYSRLYKLEHIWNLTSIPYMNYTHLSVSKTFSLKLTKDFYRLYFYTCYLYSFVKITINRQYKIIFNETHQRRNYHYISLSNDLFRSSFDQVHSIDIDVSYQSKSDSDSFVYQNRTFFNLNLAILYE